MAGVGEDAVTALDGKICLLSFFGQLKHITKAGLMDIFFKTYPT